MEGEREEKNNRLAGPRIYPRLIASHRGESLSGDASTAAKEHASCRRARISAATGLAGYLRGNGEPADQHRTGGGFSGDVAQLGGRLPRPYCNRRYRRCMYKVATSLESHQPS